ncbi:hypothetical protein K1719_036249 [Acacia pycnantha]|nr:hypothetical protein K1719_036249 [Acacia pycnantha]
MEGMSVTPSPPSLAVAASMNGTAGMQHKMMMHMSLYWGKKAEILFPRWPDDNTAMFVFALLFVFCMALLAEFLSHSRLLKPGSRSLSSGLVQTLVLALRVALSLLVMLSVMSFNVPVFLVAVAGHAVGFFLFASRAFHEPDPQKQFDLPPTTC